MLTLVIMLASAASFLGFGWAIRQRSRRQQALPRVAGGPIAQLSAGAFTRMRGTVVPMGEVLWAPLTGRPCVSYVALAVINNTNPPHYLARQSAGVRFGVDDGSGRALVEMDGTKITLAVSHVDYVSHAALPSPSAAAFLEANRVDIDLKHFPLVLNEAILEVGATIEVSGSTHRRLDPGAPSETGYRDQPATRLHFEKPDAD